MTSNAINNNNNNNNNNRKKFLLNKLDQEREVSKKNLQSIRKKWTNILSEQKLESIQHEIPVLQKRYDDEIQQRNNTIQNLMKSLEHTENQRRIATASHMQILDDMIQFHDNQLSKAEHQFCEDLEDLRRRYDTEKSQVEHSYETNKRRLEQEINRADKQERWVMDDSARDQQEAVEEIRNKNMEDINSLRFTVDTKIEDLDEQFELAKNEYIQKTDVRSESLQQQMKRDKEMSKVMVSLQRQIDELISSLKRLRAVSRRKVLQNADREQQLLQRKSEIISKYRTTKAKMEELRSMEHGKLRDLTVRANDFKTKLEKKYDLTDRILKLAKLTSKIEKEVDVEQCFNSIDSTSTNYDCNEELTSTSSGKNNKHVLTFGVDAIWSRYNKVLLHLETIEQEKEQLAMTSSVLRRNIERYNDGISVNDRVMGTENSLFVVNGRCGGDRGGVGGAGVGVV